MKDLDRAEIKPEYPAGMQAAEMTLVRMLKGRRSWACYMEIMEALWNLQSHAESMQKEQEHLCETEQAGAAIMDSNDTIMGYKKEAEGE